MGSPTYNLQQQAFTISVLSNNAAGDTGTASSIATQLESDVSGLLKSDAFQQFIGNWQLVWGPVVWQNTGSTVADNVMMAAQNQDTNDIVIAIAGTNPNSAFDRSTEDLDVGTTVQFGSDASVWISQGASDGVAKLMAMSDPSHGTIVSWLANLQPTNANLIIAGHSLGGALAPTLALTLSTTSQIPSGTFSNVYVLPTAGPSPGNQAFADLYAATFPPVASANAK